MFVDLTGLATFVSVDVDVRYAPAYVPAVISRQLSFLGFGQLCCVYNCFFDAYPIALHFYYLGVVVDPLPNFPVCRRAVNVCLGCGGRSWWLDGVRVNILRCVTT